MANQTQNASMNDSTLNDFRLDGKVAIVTGGSAWLGHDMACAFAEAGSDVIITSRTQSRAEEATEGIADAYDVDTLALEMDQQEHEQVKTMAEDARAWKGHVDILVNNAGGGSGASEGNLFERAPEDMVDLIATNLTGALFCCQEVGRFMVEQKHGKIINIASMAGMVGRDRRMYRRNEKEEQPIDYAASKAGVIGMTKDLAGLLSPQGVHVNAISPGGFDKGDLPDGFVEDYGDATMLGRMGRMGKDLKGAALFLASPASDYVTGHNLVVDGGFSVWK
jgi:NAD(P)-dependent dehydrogenase (short-subunit alcohol dehydrogenase family)